jgi:cytochrome c-type biogenesis protein CcmH
VISLSSARSGLLAALLLVLAFAGSALAVEPLEMLKDPALEARARTISRELRCLVCQNQSIDDSNADLAHDLRVIVRERLAAGDSDAQVKAYLVARYGDFVLLDPPFETKTLMLWLGPAILLLLGAGGIYALLRRRPAAAPEAPLSEAEHRRLAELTAEDGETAGSPR